MRTLPSLLTIALAAVPLLGCGDGGGDTLPDAEPPADVLVPDTITLTLHARGTSLLAIREGDGPWRELTPGANGDAVVDVARGRYAITAVCDTPDYFNDYVILAGPDDPREHDVYCISPATERVKITVASDDDVLVRIGFLPVGAGGTLEIDAGTYDLIAVERTVGTPRFVIRRGAVLDEDMTLTFDLDTQGTPMRRASVTAALAEGETATVSARLSTARGASFSVTSADPASALMFPGSALQTGDSQAITLDAERDDAPGMRGGSRAITGDPATVAIALPPALTSASATWNGAMAVRWEAAGAWTNAYAYATDEEFTDVWDIFALPGWFAAGGDANALTMPAPADLPGWDPAWTVASTTGMTWDLSLYGSGAAGTEHLGWTAPFDAASARHAHRDAEEVRAARVLRHQRLGVR